VELPSSKAEHLHNPVPDYPRMSVKLGEQGQVMVRVLIGADGVPQKVELHSSSGFERLDKAGMDAAMRWRYVPGKRGGVAEAMWFLQPITFNLKKE
jgi:protein TonB